VQPEPDPRVADLADRYSAEATGYLETYAPELMPFTRRLLSMLEPAGARRILDLGAGTGWLSALLSRHPRVARIEPLPVSSVTCAAPAPMRNCASSSAR